MNRREFIRTLVRMEACGASVDWARKTKGTPRDLWHKCKRGDWLLWLVRRMELALGRSGAVIERIHTPGDEELVAHAIRAVVLFEDVEAKMLARCWPSKESK